MTKPELQSILNENFPNLDFNLTEGGSAVTGTATLWYFEFRMSLTAYSPHVGDGNKVNLGKVRMTMRLRAPSKPPHTIVDETVKDADDAVLVCKEMVKELRSVVAAIQQAITPTVGGATKWN